MRPYEPSLAGRCSIGKGPYATIRAPIGQPRHLEEGTVCDHMSPHKPAVAPRGRDRMRPYEPSLAGRGFIGKGPYATIQAPTGRPRRQRERDCMRPHEPS